MRIALGLLIGVLLSIPAHAAEPTTKPTVLLLLRFAPLNDAAGTEWIGRAVQESLLTDAARIKSVRVVASQQAPTTDIATARQLARDAHADLVVLGGHQTLGDNLKITGQIVQVDSGEILGALKSTATVRDVFAMEETLSRQLERSLSTTNARGSAAGPDATAIDDLGPVRLASFARPFAAPKSDPFKTFRDRHTYGIPAYSPYFWGYGCGWHSSCYGYRGGGYIYPCGITPTSIFYGD